MAGGGGGRGRRMMSFSVEAVGINRGESLPPSTHQPSDLFPVMEQKPLPLMGGEEAEYLLALKQEFRGAMKTLPFFIQPAAAKRDVERYSDKYHNSEQTDGLTDWSPGVSAACRSDKLQSGQKKKKKKEKEEVLLKLEKKEEQQSSEEEEEGEEKKKKQEEEEADGEEEYDEEEFEEVRHFMKLHSPP
ncbi:DNA-directed RNA polymerase III subunit RPC7-like [Liparis tanakae]|uniref:DNA-directed RNA polymerase III subunit RPC7-like n=1 Tax=Liparis tanakae TaxID=230148 RepID=A0A4Z2ETX6_9TELE|nr:DNA-directed RNA polymerase III subunit RPC7-like [Liparis tanakae]